MNRLHTLLYRTNIENLAPNPADIKEGELAVNLNKMSPILFFKNTNNEIERIGAMSSTTGISENRTMSQKAITESFALKNNLIHETSNNINILPNKYYMWGDVADLTITLAAPTDNTIENEYIIQFNSPRTATRLLLPQNIKWLHNKPLIIKPNKTYIITIINNLAVGGEF